MATVTVAAFTIPNWHYGGTTAKLRLYSNIDWIDSAGVPRMMGEIGSATGFYQEVALTVSGTNVSVPSFSTPSTADALHPESASRILITGVLFDSSGAMRETLFSNFQIQTTSPIAYDALVIRNRARSLPQAPARYLDAAGVEAYVASILALGGAASYDALGKVKTSIVPPDPLNPRAYIVGDPDVVLTDDPRLVSQAVNVALLATGGAGTAADPYTGWDANIGTWQSNTTYQFSGKVFAFSNPIVILNVDRCRLVGVGPRATVLKFTGTGKAVTFKSTTTCFLNGIENIEIDGNALCTEGLYTESSHAMRVVNINVRNCTIAAFHVKFGILNYYENPRCSQVMDLAGGFTTVPLLGFFTEQRGGGETFQACSIVNPTFEVLLGDGMEFNDAWQVEVIGGSCEQNVGRGVLINGTCRNVSFTRTNNEGNGGDDWTIFGSYCHLDGVLSQGVIRVKPSAQMTRITGGQCNSLIAELGSSGHIESFTYNISGTGTLSLGDPYSWNLVAPLRNHAGGATGSGTTLASLGPLLLGFPLGTNEPAFDYANQAVFLLGNAGSFHSEKSTTAPTIQATLNGYYDGAAWRYRVSSLLASNYYQQAGEHVFRSAVFGTAGNAITWKDVLKISAAGVTSLYKGADAASASTITPTGNVFHVTGTTTITAISTTNLTAGAVLTLIFDASVTVQNGASLMLAGAANFSATADDVLTLVYDGSKFREVCRSVN